MKKESPEQSKVAAVNGLKAYAAIGIVFMHVLANGNYSLKGFLFESFIPALTDLVFLFMTVSGLGMCCGYYKKITKGEMLPEEFYKRRIIKIWPLFALLCITEFFVHPDINTFKELFADLILCIGFLPDPGSISVVGVGWFVGLVFVFYLIFPFYCFLLGNKKRAWSVFIISILFNLLCSDYFGIGRANILYSAPLFLGGGIVFLYRENIGRIKENFKPVILLLCIVSTVVYFLTGRNFFMIAVVSLLSLIYAVCGTGHPLLSNSFTDFLSSISFEIYLCHMPVYRVLEKAGILHAFKTELFSYLLVAILTTLGASIVAKAAQSLINRSILLCRRKNSTEP